MRTRVSRAFTLVEILIVVVILGILAAIVIPQFTNASQDAQRGNIQTQLQSIRNQIELYRVKNNGVPPGAGTATNLFTGTDNSLVDPPGTAQQAYMRSAAINPRNGSSTVVASSATTALLVAAAAAALDPAASGAGGWVYNPTTGDFAAVGFDETTNKWFGEP